MAEIECAKCKAVGDSRDATLYCAGCYERLSGAVSEAVDAHTRLQHLSSKQGFVVRGNPQLDQQVRAARGRLRQALYNLRDALLA